MKKALFIVLSIIVLVGSSCQTASENEIIGSWTGHNQSGQTVKIEFSKDGNYHLSLIDEQGVITSLSDYTIIKYRFGSEQDPNEILLFDGESKQEFAKLKASFPSSNKLALSLFDVSHEEQMDKIELSRN